MTSLRDLPKSEFISFATIMSSLRDELSNKKYFRYFDEIQARRAEMIIENMGAVVFEPRRGEILIGNY